MFAELDARGWTGVAKHLGKYPQKVAQTAAKHLSMITDVSHYERRSGLDADDELIGRDNRVLPRT